MQVQCHPKKAASAESSKSGQSAAKLVEIKENRIIDVVCGIYGKMK
jgi:hypothetical protein